MANARKGGQASSPVPRLLVLRGGLFSSTPRFAAKNGLKYKKPDMGRACAHFHLPIIIEILGENCYMLRGFIARSTRYEGANLRLVFGQ